MGAVDAKTALDFSPAQVHEAVARSEGQGAVGGEAVAGYGHYASGGLADGLGGGGVGKVFGALPVQKVVGVSPVETAGGVGCEAQVHLSVRSTGQVRAAGQDVVQRAAVVGSDVFDVG